MVINGLVNRLKSDLVKRLPSLPPTVTLLDGPTNAAFVGGSIAASTSIGWITRAEYEEVGQDIVRSKFPSLLEAGLRAGANSWK